MADPAWTGRPSGAAAYVVLEPGERVSIYVTAEVKGQYRVFMVYDKQLGPADDVAVEVRVDGARPMLTCRAAPAIRRLANDSYLWLDSIYRGVLQPGEHTSPSPASSGEARRRHPAATAIEYRMLSADDGDTVTLSEPLGHLTPGGSPARADHPWCASGAPMVAVVGEVVHRACPSSWCPSALWLGRGRGLRLGETTKPRRHRGPEDKIPVSSVSSVLPVVSVFSVSPWFSLLPP